MVGYSIAVSQKILFSMKVSWLVGMSLYKCCKVFDRILGKGLANWLLILLFE